MKHFRIRYQRISYLRWRCRATSRQALLMARPLLTGYSAGPSAAAWRRAIPVMVLLKPAATVLRVGDFVVGEEGDPQLLGHPDIMY
ncbi:hypothetical protein [Hymenobacter sp. IS2118]|uniref:hypothetical protein n=1 Tax=Hymenobacter sp. IS2118 TaxID=1505605 RepID=UPI00054D883B|nr:hypothetical protein [Hymenobacter sp. IS2118]